MKQMDASPVAAPPPGWLGQIKILLTVIVRGRPHEQ